MLDLQQIKILLLHLFIHKSDNIILSVLGLHLLFPLIAMEGEEKYRQLLLHLLVGSASYFPCPNYEPLEWNQLVKHCLLGFNKGLFNREKN